MTTEQASAVVIRGGIDVSSHKGEIDWPTVADAWLGGDGIKYPIPVSFAILKATEGVDFIDERFFENALGCSAAGLEWSAYHFATPNFGSPEQPDAIPEAKDFLAAVMEAESRPGVVPAKRLYLDLEKNNANLSREAYADWTWTWCRHVHSWCTQHGRPRPGIYISQRNAARWLPLVHGLGYWPLWVPDYSERPPRLPQGWATWSLIQSTSSGDVDGVDSENVDCNIMAVEPVKLQNV